MANSYSSLYTGAHNDQYNTRITNLEATASALVNKVTTFTAQITTLQASTTAIATTAASKVAKAGDTMTGGLTIKDTRITGTVTGNTVYGLGITLSDTNNTTVARYDSWHTTAQRAVRLYCQDVNSSSTPIWNILTIGFNESDKSRFVTVSDQNAWKKGLGVGKAYGVQKWAATTFNASTITSTKSISITTIGRPVFLSLTGDMNPLAATSTWAGLEIKRGSTILCTQNIQADDKSSHNQAFALNYLDAVSAGTYTYTATIYRGGAGHFVAGEAGNVMAPQFVAFEI